MKAYSVDLRARLIAAYENKEGSQRQLAKRFNVALSTVYTWIKRYRTTGSVDALPHAGGAKPKLDTDQMAVLEHLLDQHRDATFEELTVALFERTGVQLHPSTLWRYSVRLNQTYKKNTARH